MKWRKRYWQTRLAIVALVLLIGMVGIRHILSDPDTRPDSRGGAEWIRYREPVRLKGRGAEQMTTSFRHAFNLKKTPAEAILTVRAMKRVTVHVDGRLAFSGPEDLQRWEGAS